MSTNKMYINRAAETFNKSIPFKVYRIADSKVSGTIEHTHDYMQIWYVLRGCCEHYINDKCHMLVKGNLFTLPPFVMHKIKVIPEEEIEIIGCEFLTDFVSQNEGLLGKGTGLFDFAYLEPFLLTMEEVRPRLKLAGKSQLKVEELMLEMYQEYCHENKYYEILIKSDLLKLLTVIAREYEEHEDPIGGVLYERYREAISAAIEYVNQHYTGNIYIKDVSKIAMMSQTYFTYLFKQITGYTFIEYVTRMRIRKAMEMLEGHSIPITDICYAVGFNSAAYFNKVFRKETGLSPRQYRKSIIK